jgi:site-specific DNA-cytosine methylase
MLCLLLAGRNGDNLQGGSVRVLVACEFSGAVRDAFALRGHDAWSVDLLPSEKPGNHFQQDCREVLDLGWDLLICHPPCTHLAVSGARWFKDKQTEQAEALELVRLLLAAPVPRIALENPVSIISSRVRKPDQTIQPWQFGHGEVKATCLWLKGLPKLRPSNIVEGRTARVHREPPGPNRWKNRSRTLQGIADAMAEQWGDSAIHKATATR